VFCRCRPAFATAAPGKGNGQFGIGIDKSAFSERDICTKFITLVLRQALG
jgi:hypothetical protein